MNSSRGSISDVSVEKKTLVCRDLSKLSALREYAEDPLFLEKWAAVKRQAKVKAAAFLKERTGITISPDAMFDVQVCLITSDFFSK